MGCFPFRRKTATYFHTLDFLSFFVLTFHPHNYPVIKNVCWVVLAVFGTTVRFGDSLAKMK